MLDLGGKWLSLFISDLGVILAQAFQDKVRYVFYLVLPFLFATNIIDLSRLKIIYDIGEGMAGILHVVEDAFMTQVNGVWLVSECFVDKSGDYPAVGAVISWGP